MIQHFIQSINQLQAISLDKLDSVSLLDRIDKKFVLNSEQLQQIIPCLMDNYFVLEIGNTRVFSYENNYFDTNEYQFYKDHHNGYAHRIKVRSRKYVESNLSFFEIKKKEKISRTNKFREKIPEIISSINELHKEKIKEFTHKNLEGLTMNLQNNFSRITLVNQNFTERVTIDFDLKFIKKEQSISLDKIAVIEIKQSKMTQSSPMASFLKLSNIRGLSFSKYIYGVLLFNKEIKRNNFLKLINKINKIQ